MSVPWDNNYSVGASSSDYNNNETTLTNQPEFSRYIPIAPYGGDISGKSNNETENRKNRRACDQCRQKKIKCQFLEASQSCRKCIQLKRECTFNMGIKKRGPPRGYIGVLEDRLKRIEGLISGMKSDTTGRSKEISENITNSQSVLEYESNDRDVHTIIKKQRLNETDDIAADEADIEYANNFFQNTQFINEGRYISENNILRLIFEGKLGLKNRKALLSRYDIDIQQNKDSNYYFIKKPISNEDYRKRQIDNMIKIGVIKPNETIKGVSQWIYKVSGIDKDLSDRLLKIYFAYIHPLLPVVNKTAFLEEYRGIHARLPYAPLLNAIFGASLRYIENCKKFNDLERLYDGQPWDYSDDLQKKLFQNLILFLGNQHVPNIYTVQALIIAHNYISTVDNWTTGWLLNCVAVRMAQDLGLHRSANGWNLTEQEKETRRMVWWSAYVLDRWFSAGSGRPLTIFDEDCDEQYPSEHANLDEVMDTMTEKDQHLPRFLSLDIDTANKATDSKVPMNAPFIQFIKISEILGLVLQNLYTPRAKKHSAQYGSDAVVGFLDDALSKWRAALPPLLDISTAGEKGANSKNHVPLLSTSGLICLSYCTVLILLHRPFIENAANETKVSNEKSKLSSKSSLTICTSAAIRIVEVAESMKYRDFLMVSWGFALYPVFTAALIHIYNCSNPDSIVSDVAKSNLLRALAVVDKLCMLSPMSISMADVLKKIIASSSIFDNDPEFSSTTITCTKEIHENVFSFSNIVIDQKSRLLSLGNQNTSDKLKNKEKSVELDSSIPSVDEDWLSQLYTPTQSTFNLDDVLTPTTTKVDLTDNQKQKKNADTNINRVDAYSIRQFGFNMTSDIRQQGVDTTNTSFSKSVNLQRNSQSSYHQNNGVTQSHSINSILNNPSSSNMTYMDFNDNSRNTGNNFAFSQSAPTNKQSIQNVAPLSLPYNILDTSSPLFLGSHMFNNDPNTISTTPMNENNARLFTSFWTSEANDSQVNKSSPSSINNTNVQQDPSVIFRHSPGNPFWGIPSSMQADEWIAFLVPHQQQEKQPLNKNQ